MIEVRAIAVLCMTDDEGIDDKVICVPFGDPNWSDLESLDDIPKRLRVEIEHFFSIYKEPEGKDVEVRGFRDRDEALRIIDEARARAQ